MTQLLPTDDDFAAGTPTMGSFATLYLGCQVSSANVPVWNPTATSFIVRPIHGAYQTLTSDGKNDFNAAFHSTGNTTRAASGAIFRVPQPADCTTIGRFEMRSLAGGAPGLADFAPRGVIARVQGGTIGGNGTADVRYRDVDCYMAALYQKASDNTLRLGIFRWNAGAMFTGAPLAESVSLASGTTVITAIGVVTLIVSGTGGTVTLTARVSGLGSTATLSINTTDTDVNRITAAGRSGFFMGSDRIISGKTTVDLCHMLAVDSGGTRLLQDEFRRLSLAGAKQTSADGAGTAGSGYLSSAYYWDAATYDGTDVEGALTFAGSKRLVHSASTINFDNQITDDNGPSSRHAPGRLILSQRPADNLFSQHRTVSITLPNSGHPTAATGEVWAGIALRAAQAKPRDQTAGVPGQGINANPNVPGGTAYVLAIRAKTSTQMIFQLHRIKNNAHTAIARKTENSPFVGAFPGYGTPFTLELEVYPRDEADPFGVVEIVCKVDGTLLAFDTFLAPGGVTNPSTGKFHDGSTGRISNNFGEGLFVCNGLTSTGTDVNNYDPIFDAWTQGALTNAALLDQDQASVAVAAEAASPSASTLPLPPDWPFEMEFVSHEVSTPYASGYRQTMPRYIEHGTDELIQRRVFKFSGIANATILGDLKTHWNNMDGTELPFEWTPVGDTLRVVHYASDLRYDLIEAGVWRVEFELEEKRT